MHNHSWITFQRKGKTLLDWCNEFQLVHLIPRWPWTILNYWGNSHGEVWGRLYNWEIFYTCKTTLFTDFTLFDILALLVLLLTQRQPYHPRLLSLFIKAMIPGLYHSYPRLANPKPDKGLNFFQRPCWFSPVRSKDGWFRAIKYFLKRGQTSHNWQTSGRRYQF